mgnify:CR=1 FL=1
MLENPTSTRSRSQTSPKCYKILKMREAWFWLSKRWVSTQALVWLAMVETTTLGVWALGACLSAWSATENNSTWVSALTLIFTPSMGTRITKIPLLFLLSRLPPKVEKSLKDWIFVPYFPNPTLTFFKNDDLVLTNQFPRALLQIEGFLER